MANRLNLCMVKVETIVTGAHMYQVQLHLPRYISQALSPRESKMIGVQVLICFLC